MENIKIISKYDNLELSVSYSTPKKPKALIVFSHGMSEHKERYFNLMNYLSDNGYMCIIHDHRGHGQSIKNNSYGDFYTTSYDALVLDLKQVIEEFNSKYPNLEVYLFSHSMGTLVARCFIQKYDNLISKLILSGPPTKNSLAKLGIHLSKKAYKKSKDLPADKINKIAFSKVNSQNKIPNDWLCTVKKEVEKYNNDPLCGFVFKPSGFICLFSMVRDSFILKKYLVNNNNLKIFIIGGGSDPVINGYKKFNGIAKLFNKVGYKNVSKKLYIKMKHEILNESAKALVYQDILKFYNE